MAESPPDLKIPSSDNTVEVFVIDTTAHVSIPAALFMKPPMAGHEMLQAACYAFLVKHNNPAAESKYDTLVFDLGVRKDIENAPKAIQERITGPVSVKIESDVLNILKDNGEDPKEVGAIIWVSALTNMNSFCCFG
jgi:hypothetical protein